MKFCANCGNQMHDTDNACSQCGTLVDRNLRAYYPVQNEPKESNVKAIVGLILGLCSNIFFWVPFLPVAGSIIGIVISVMGMKDADIIRNGKGIAIGGLACSILALIIGGMLTSCYMCYGCIIFSDTTWM